ncbi:unnamed protein product [Arabidopsis halleri]
MVETELKKKTSIMPDWSELPDELLYLILTYLGDNCFDVVHARSVCSLWRSTLPLSPVLRPSYSLPAFGDFPLESKGLCTLEKVPKFLFIRVPTPAIADDQLSDALQCLVKVKIPASVPKKIVPLGHKYRMIGWDYNRAAFLRLDKEGKREEFVVLLKYSGSFLVLTSAEMRWKKLENVPNATCFDIVTFRGRFYAQFLSGHIVVIDPYSLEVTLLLFSPEESRGLQSLVPYGKDELFLVEVIIPEDRVIDLSRLTRRVRRLDEEAGIWVEVSDFGDCVFLLGNLSCSAKEFPHGFGLTKNAVLFTDKSGNAFLYYKRNVILKGESCDDPQHIFSGHGSPG